MDNGDWYVIADLDRFVDATRAIVFNSFGRDQNDISDEVILDVVSEEDRDELDRLLSYDETMLIVKDFIKQQKHKTTSATRHLVSDNSYSLLISALNQRMVGNILTGLVNRGLVESAFDSDANDFVFWVKDEKTEKKENPETD